MAEVFTPRDSSLSINHCPSVSPTTPTTPTLAPNFAKPHAVIAAPPPISRQKRSANNSSPARPGHEEKPLMTSSVKRSPTTITSSGRGALILLLELLSAGTATQPAPVRATGTQQCPARSERFPRE